MPFILIPKVLLSLKEKLSNKNKSTNSEPFNEFYVALDSLNWKENIEYEIKNGTDDMLEKIAFERKFLGENKKFFKDKAMKKLKKQNRQFVEKVK